MYNTSETLAAGAAAALGEGLVGRVGCSLSDVSVRTGEAEGPQLILCPLPVFQIRNWMLKTPCFGGDGG